MIYEISIEQTQDKTGLHLSFNQLYADLAALKKAFNEMNSEQMFGELVDENITPCWENDCYSRVIRKKRNWTTIIKTCFVVPRTVQNLELEGAFHTERNMGVMAIF